ncbi:MULTISPECIES: hypothetical protein [unclassified Streptomyces]|uniref:hypothetical protein n=1 Tax=unclassified Streptomyces TaxID=2593676 RepID=UPI002254DF9F|nr:hypothetical protein [Streptomyces sp. NBC_01264]MCX4783868.1 hypothetical protein [Streptomyces sp. NBC_01264]
MFHTPGTRTRWTPGNRFTLWITSVALMTIATARRATDRRLMTPTARRTANRR